jgi:hypothetical protein
VGGNSHDRHDQYGWHKDSDPGYNHPLSEKNFIIPLTNSRDTASVYIEDAPDSDTFTPAAMNVGEVFNFDCKKQMNLRASCISPVHVIIFGVPFTDLNLKLAYENCSTD